MVVEAEVPVSSVVRKDICLEIVLKVVAVVEEAVEVEPASSAEKRVTCLVSVHKVVVAAEAVVAVAELASSVVRKAICRVSALKAVAAAVEEAAVETEPASNVAKKVTCPASAHKAVPVAVEPVAAAVAATEPASSAARKATCPETVPMTTKAGLTNDHALTMATLKTITTTTIMRGAVRTTPVGRKLMAGALKRQKTTTVEKPMAGVQVLPTATKTEAAGDLGVLCIS